MPGNPSTPLPNLRRATNADSATVRKLVDGVLQEFGLTLDPKGTDADLEDFDEQYHRRGGDFVVLENAEGKIVGACGLYPLEPGVVELRKMYLARAHRGTGQGRRLLDWALGRARELGFRRVTLETASVLKDAIALYERHGFRRDEQGCHSCRCDLAYTREL